MQRPTTRSCLVGVVETKTSGVEALRVISRHVEDVEGGVYVHA
jgi:hypothetical protein